MKVHARSMNIPLVWQADGKGPNDMAQERVWRVEE